MSPLAMLALEVQASGGNAVWAQIAIVAALVVAAVCLFFFGVRALRRKRLIENVPTSKVEGVCIGLTELKGTAEKPHPLHSYLAEIDCVYYRFSVEEHWRKTETYTDKDGKRKTRTRSGWRTVRSDEQRPVFRLRDDTGEIRLVPDKAEIHPDRVFSRTCGRWDRLYYSKGPRYAIANSTHSRRFTEHAIPLGKDIYCMGTARLRQDAVLPEIAHDADDPLYLISTLGEDRIVRGYAWKSALMIPLGGAAAVGLPIVLPYAGITSQPVPIWVPILVGVAYAGLVFAMYLQTVYNGLIDLKNRLQNAWSMMDVQLKRRHDLIPNLANAVKGYVEHEKGVQETIAEMRARGFQRSGAIGLPDHAQAILLAQAANQQTSLLKSLYANVERYPELKADEQFRKLAEEIARTERKIALARSFFNESVTALNNRIDTMPDVLIAKPFGFQPGEYFQIEAFEKEPVQISFEEEEPEVEAPSYDDEAVPADAEAVSEDQIAELQAAGPKPGEDRDADS
jgi:hypothetical protein